MAREPVGPAHEKLGRLMRTLRERRGLTGREVKTVSAAYLSEIENGLVTPAPRTLDKLVRELRGDPNAFKGVLAAAKKERDLLKEKMKERREELNLVEMGVIENEVIVPRTLTFAIIDDETGEAKKVDPLPADPRSMNFRGPFIVDQIDEEHFVNAEGILWKSIFRRTIRALESGVQSFPFSFGETAGLEVEKIQVGVRLPATIERALQVGDVTYKIDITLPKMLEKNESCEIVIYKILEAVGYCDPFIGGSCARPLKSGRLKIFFEEGFEPNRVWWFENLPPYSLPGIYSSDRELRRRATGEYEATFANIDPAMLFGIAWT